jgi:hypothetical protein
MDNSNAAKKVAGNTRSGGTEKKEKTLVHYGRRRKTKNQEKTSTPKATGKRILHIT